LKQSPSLFFKLYAVMGIGLFSWILQNQFEAEEEEEEVKNWS